MSKIHVDEVIPKGRTYPMIVNFQNAYTTDEFKKKPCMLFENTKNGSKTIAMELDGLLYVGNEEQEKTERTVLLARNRITGKTRLIEVGCADLKPVSTVDTNTSQLLETDNTELSRKFGSKKQKQKVEQREKLKVNTETVTEQMQNVSKNITEDQLDISSYNKDDSNDFYIPPINRTATRVEDVYELYKILTQEQFETIYSEIEKENYRQDLHEFVKNIVSAKTLTPTQAVLAVYASCLLRLTLLTAKDIVKKTFRACQHSATLNEIIINNFTTVINGKRNRPMPYKDKSMCHAIVYLLLINNFKLDVQELSASLKITPATVGNKIRVIGASIAMSGTKKIVQLKLPLNTMTVYRRKSAKF